MLYFIPHVGLCDNGDKKEQEGHMYISYKLVVPHINL